MIDGAVLAESVLRSAEEAFARVMNGVPEQVETMPPDLAPADALRWAGDRVTEMLAGLAELPLDRLADLALDRPVGRSNRSDGPDRSELSDRSGAEPVPQGEPIVVRAARGSSVEARIWAHPIGRLTAPTLRFALGDLVGPDGTAWRGGGAVFTPAELVLSGPAAASTVLRLEVPDQAALGEHHGLIIGFGAAGAVLPITVVVT